MSDARDTDVQRLVDLLQDSQSKSLTPEDMKQLRYAIYARKSTTSEDRQASSIEDQVKECIERVAIPNGLNVVEIYEESYSAKVADTREKFKQLVDNIEKGLIDGLIAWHPDRLSRNMKEAGTVIDLVDRGIIKDLRFPTFTFENTPAGKMLLGITFVMAKQYSEHLAESVDRGNRRAIEDGEFIGKFKHGYILDVARRFQSDPDNFVKVKHMFEMAIGGKSQKEIRNWINDQHYTVQKRLMGDYESHVWDKDDVSKLLRDPYYAGVLKWGKNITNLVDAYDFQPMITVNDFLKINKVDNIKSSRILSINRPKGGNIRANLLRGKVYCGSCHKTLTSMLIDKRSKETGEVKESRYYYKCETVGCSAEGKSARAKVVLDAAQSFFEGYLFVTEGNYAYFVDLARKAAKHQAEEYEREINRLKVTISNKERDYENAKVLIMKNPELATHYKLDSYTNDIEKLKSDYEMTIIRRANISDHIPVYKDYLKLLETTPVILNKIHDMNSMDQLLRIFFSNFTITPGDKGFSKGSKVSYKLNEPWKGFVKSNDFVRGAGNETLTRGLILGKDAL